MSPLFYRWPPRRTIKTPFTFNAQLSLQYPFPPLAFHPTPLRSARAPPSLSPPAANGLCAPWNIQREIARTLKTLKIKIAVKRLAWGHLAQLYSDAWYACASPKWLPDLYANTVPCIVSYYVLFFFFHLPVSSSTVLCVGRKCSGWPRLACGGIWWNFRPTGNNPDWTLIKFKFHQCAHYSCTFTHWAFWD